MSLPRRYGYSTLRRRFGEGPNASIAEHAGWQWYELGWVVLLFGWLATTGRPPDLLVAGGLVVAWVFGPAVGVFVGGNLAVLALGVPLRSGWLLPVTELVLLGPLLIEIGTVAESRAVAVVYTATTAGIVGAAAAGGWGGLPPDRVAGIVVVGALCCLLGTAAWLRTPTGAKGEDGRGESTDQS